MSTRDPRSRDYPEPPTQPGDGGREPTQSIDLDASLDAGLDAVAPSPSLALGTRDHQATSIESPNARGRPLGPAAPLPPPPVPARRRDAPDPYLGTVLGSYRLLALLGKGGMGHVYRAEHVKLGREVALKLLRSDYASRRDAVARFFQEARTVTRIRHRNIVEVTDFVEFGDGTTYIIMELLAGTSLGAWARGGIDLQRALSVVTQICDGLAAAHQLAIVHRDLKPDNVIICPTPEGGELVKLLDFGVAKLLDREDEDYEIHTAAGSVIGTPSYMSPEQAGGMVVDARSDIYSLGAIMYELFCGQPMFRGRSFGDYVRLHLTEVPVPPRRTAGGAHIDRQLEAVILRCLEKDPEHRFSSISELRDALISLHGPLHGSLHGPLHGAPLAVTSSQVSHPQSSSLRSGAQPLPAPPGVLDRQAPAPPASAWWVWAGAAGAAIAIGLAAAVWYTGDRAAGGTTSAPTVASASPPAPRPSPAPPQPARVELRFDSQPSGGVFAAGEPTELCHTPCALQIDRGGSAGDRRAFVVRRDGYRDGAITVDLSSAQRDFRIELQAMPPPAAVRPSADPRPDRKPGRRRDQPASAQEPRAASREPRAHPVDPPIPPPPEPVLAKPSSPESPETTRPPAIDPSDTLDPFRKK
jgi:serine/threonine protein kinase